MHTTFVLVDFCPPPSPMSIVVRTGTANVSESVLSRVTSGSMPNSDWSLLTIPPEITLRIRVFQARDSFPTTNRRVSRSGISRHSGSSLPFASVSAARCPHFGPNPSQEPTAFHCALQSCPFTVWDQFQWNFAQTQYRTTPSKGYYEGVGD